MKNNLTFVILFLLITLSAAGESTAADLNDQNWPQWRGPQTSGLSPTAQPPVSWSETNNIRWKVKIPGSGTATPIVWENQIFIQTAVRGGKTSSSASPNKSENTGAQRGPGGMRSETPTELYRFLLLCLDRKTGKTLWEKTAREEVPHEGHHPDHGFSSSSPITDGKYVFAYFGSRGMHCYDLEGNLKWEKDFGRMQTKMSFGEGSSAALFENTLVVKWDHEGEDFIAALNKETGKELWRQPRDEDTSWSTPLIVREGARTEVVTAATRKVRSYDLATGKLLWECAGLTPNAIPSPVAGNGMVYVTSGFRGNALMAIKLGRDGDITGTDAIAWSYHKSTPYVPSPLLYGDKLYLFGNNNGILSCFDANSGRPLMEAERIEALPGVYSSPVGADGRIYLVGRNGVTVVIKRSDKLEILATNRLEENFDASPALAGKDLFLRGREYLYCISASPF